MEKRNSPIPLVIGAERFDSILILGVIIRSDLGMVTPPRRCPTIGGDLVLGLGGTGEGAAEGRSARRAAPSRGRGLGRGMCPLPI